MSDMPTKSELRTTWESAAPGWVKWEHVFTTSLADATDQMLDMAGVSAGKRVLDIACGAGSQSIEAARRVGPDGRVVACDISGTMLDNVKRNAEHAGLQNVETLECPADELAGNLAPFDAGMCRLGLMLIPKPGTVLTAIRRVLKPGARFAALVFTTASRNAFLAEPMAVLLRHAGKVPPAPGQPGIFALGGAGVLEELLHDNGFDSITMKQMRAPLVVPSARDALQLLKEAAGAYRAIVADLSDEEQTRAWEEVYEGLRKFESGGRFETALDVVIGSAAKPT